MSIAPTAGPAHSGTASGRSAGRLRPTTAPRTESSKISASGSLYPSLSATRLCPWLAGSAANPAGGRVRVAIWVGPGNSTYSNAAMTSAVERTPVAAATWRS
jgi:hypothetical protein